MNPESKQLRNTILDWQHKVGIKFEIDEFEDESNNDGLEEFD